KISSADAPRQSPTGDTYFVSFDLTEEGIQQFAQAMRESGAASNPSAHQVIMYFNDQEVFRAPLASDLANSIEQGTWQGSQGLQVTGINDIQQARKISVSLKSGALPTQIEVASSTTISPSQGTQFKTFSLIAGLIAVLVVGLTIYWRYRDLRIAVPMVLTGLSEVIALLGFAAALSINLDLSHIAGLIAVVGTGVDDLVIITDEVLERGEIRSSGVYKKRLRRAFIIIGMAATTTIGAMAPLAFLGLGRLTGFAVVTIVGVLIGVLITRPAFGSILGQLLTEK
ncbi:MAG: preprotein translocase subunit SecD, partial [Halobacteria archaeon]|nr:preprotein translocase subunit SecD [Halobacteria archaeon]